jgi:phosphoesterase RecJ-like protein
MKLDEKLKLAYSKIKAARRILLIGHSSPDADAFASLGAMLEISNIFGAGAYAYTDKKNSGAYDFIPHENLVKDSAPDDLLAFEAIVILDCGSISRTGLEARLRTMLKATAEGRISRRPYIIEFDHHEQQEKYADLEIRLPDKASTTEIIYHFLKINDLEINKILANCILIGLMTDTGHFLHANSSREAIAVASEMLMRGAALPKIVQNTIHNKSFVSLKVWGRILENMVFNPETGLAVSALSEVELTGLIAPTAGRSTISPILAAELLGADLFGDIVSFLSQLAGVRVALLLREEGGRVKGSLRTTDEEADVAAIAQKFGGGGHKKAAGFTLPGRLVRTNKGWTIKE